MLAGLRAGDAFLQYLILRECCGFQLKLTRCRKCNGQLLHCRALTSHGDQRVTQRGCCLRHSTGSGNEFACSDIESLAPLGNALVASYSTAIRRGGEAHGEPLGALVIFFDWQTQADAVVASVKFSDEERGRARALILDSSHRVIAASDGKGALSEVMHLPSLDKPTGQLRSKDGTLLGYAKTPGYETYRGMGWFGVVTLRPSPPARQPPPAVP